ncbi:MAG: long-chain fatty acid--CoA ligase [Candidatus Acidiferrales bacterium]
MNGTMMNYPLTLVPMLERAGKLFGQVEIVSRLPDRSLHRTTYADFYRRARALAESLSRAGLKPGDRVGTLMWNHYAHLEAYFGIPIAGGVAHTLNLRLSPNQLAYVINHAQDRFLIVDDVLLPLYEKIKGQVKPERVLVVPLTGKPVPKGYDSYEAFLGQASGNFSYPKLEENQAAAMCYTSGTTGKPKGVLYSHRALVLHSFAIGLTDTFALSQHDTILPVVPMFHANAWGIPFVATMLGSKQVFPGPHLDAENLLDLYEKERVTFAAGVPTIWFALLEALEKNPGRWKLTPGMHLLVGGAAAPESMLRRYDQLGLHVIHAWGMTEMTPAGSVSKLKPGMDDWPEDKRYQVRAKQGLPMPFVETRAVSEDGEVPWNGQSMGELQVRGPWVAASYYNLPEERDKWTSDGWFRTGDVVTIDPEGYIKITDRIKDLIKSGGEWISSVDLENALMAHPSVKEAAVIAIPHPKWQERPLAVVVPKETNHATAEELKTFLAANFARWQLPDAFVFTESIPRTSTGKFLKTKLREQFADWKWDS